MKLALGFAALSLVSLSSFVMGCSSSEDSAAASGPVAAKPLAGSIEGKTFSAKTALAHKSGFSSDADDGKRSIDIYEDEVSCDDFGHKSDRSILFSVPWKAGTQRDFKLDFSSEGQTATFVIQRDGKTDNIISTQGRVEIIEAPTEKGSKGKIRIRATAQSNSVEGEIAVTMCD